MHILSVTGVHGPGGWFAEIDGTRRGGKHKTWIWDTSSATDTRLRVMSLGRIGTVNRLSLTAKPVGRHTVHDRSLGPSCQDGTHPQCEILPR